MMSDKDQEKKLSEIIQKLQHWSQQKNKDEARKCLQLLFQSNVLSIFSKTKENEVELAREALESLFEGQVQRQNISIIEDGVYVKDFKRFEFDLLNKVFNGLGIPKIIFSHCQFLTNGAHLPIKEVVFEECEFFSEVSFQFNQNFSFIKCLFKEKVFCPPNKISEDVIFQASVFEGDVDFKACRFEKNVDFKACRFEKNVDFVNVKFKSNVYFNNAFFNQKADFHESEYEKIACFYGVTFDSIPNFSQAIFKDSANFVNVDMDYDFAEMEKTLIEETERRVNELKEENSDRELQIARMRPKVANDYRDTFRVFKKLMIKEENSLDATRFHKYELYCKEIELTGFNDKGVRPKNLKDGRKNLERMQKILDRYQLAFYRKLCDHHTNLLRVINNFVILVVLFALFALSLQYLLNPNFSWGLASRADETIAKMLNLFSSIPPKIWFILAVLVSLCLGCLGCRILCFLKGNKNTDSLKNIVWSSIKNLSFAIVSELYAYVVLGVIIVSIILISREFLGIVKPLFQFGYILAFCLFFVFLFIRLIFVEVLVIRIIYVMVSWFGFLYILSLYPYFVNPLVGKLVGMEDCLEIAKNPFFMSLSIMYSFLMLLVIFSLQKTARKNSIIPN